MSNPIDQTKQLTHTRPGRMVAAVVMVAAFATSAAALAQSTSDVSHALDALSPLVKQSDAARQNLQQMLPALRGKPEFNDVNAIFNESLDVNGTMDEARTTAIILVNMECPGDAQYVRKILRRAARHAVNVAVIDLNGINSELTQLTTPAVIAEATKIRDQIVDMRDILMPFAGKE